MPSESSSCAKSTQEIASCDSTQYGIVLFREALMPRVGWTFLPVRHDTLSRLLSYPFTLSSHSRIFPLRIKPHILTALFALLFCNASIAADRPNILVFLVDDMGVMDTSVPFLTDEQGAPKRYPLNEYYRTPSMERLAHQGIRFNQFYAMSVCSPTRISIMTGQNAARHRTTNWINPATDNRGTFGAPEWNWTGLKVGDVTLPSVLADNGYTTIHIGKAHFGPDDHEGAEPLNLGFHKNVAGASFGAPGSYLAEKGYGWLTKRQHNRVPHLEKYHGTDTFLSEALTIEAKHQLDLATTEGKPFYMYFAHYAVHAPFDSDPRFAANYEDADKPANAKAFATLIEGMDKSLGDMLDHLETLGEAENTLILFLGDNGSDAPLGHQHKVACAAPLRGKKGAHYEGGMRVPFIAAWAKVDPNNKFQQQLAIPADVVHPQVANVTDIFPSIVELLEVDVPAEHKLDGNSMLKMLTGAPDDDREETFLMHYPHGKHRSNYFTVYREDDWKVIYHTLPDETAKGDFLQSEGTHYQLFNLAEDPFEQNNLAEKQPERLVEMMQKLTEQLEAHEAVYPVDAEGEVLKPLVPTALATAP